MQRVLTTTLMLLVALCTRTGIGAEWRVTPDDYRATLKQLQPGDTVIFGPGTYLRGLPLHGIKGTPEAPIILTGERNARGAVTFVARPCCNTVSLKDSRHIIVQDLRIDGKGIAVDAVKAEGDADFVHDVTIQRLDIVGHDASRGIVGISTKCPAWNWVIRENRITGAGTGIYLGDSDGSAPFINGVIERNIIDDSIGYNLQIKHQTQRDDVAKTFGLTHDYQTRIEANLFSKRARSETGGNARPNVLIGALPTQGPGANDQYIVQRNLFYQNPTENLFQGEGNIALISNLMINDHNGGIEIRPHNGKPRDIQLLYNTIITRGRGVKVVGIDNPRPPTLLGNIVFAGSTSIAPAGFSTCNPESRYRSSLVTGSLQTGDRSLRLQPPAESYRLDKDCGHDTLGLDTIPPDMFGNPRPPLTAGALPPDAVNEEIFGRLFSR